MADETYAFLVNTPIGTALASPLVTNLTMPARTVRSIEVRIPPGPNGELGFAIGMNGVSVVPVTPGTWIVTSDEVKSWDVTLGLNSGAWQCLSYNTGDYPHAIQIIFHVDQVTPDPSASIGAAIDPNSIVAAANTDLTDTIQ